MLLCLINNFLSPLFRHGKILYFNDANYQILAYYYSNENNYSNKYIKKNINTISPQFIGKIEIDNEWLSDINVDEPFQRHGIGATLVALALQYLDLQYIACVQPHEAYCYCLTRPGEYLIASCLRHDILKEQHCYFSQDLLDMIEDGKEDPGLNSLIVKKAVNFISSCRLENDDFNIGKELGDNQFTPYSQETAGELSAFINPAFVSSALYSQSQHTHLAIKQAETIQYGRGHIMS